MENSPPGIQTIPSGAGPGGEAGFDTVGRNPATTDVGAGTAETSDGLKDRDHAVNKNAAVIITEMIAVSAMVERRRRR